MDAKSLRIGRKAFCNSHHEQDCYRGDYHADNNRQEILPHQFQNWHTLQYLPPLPRNTRLPEYRRQTRWLLSDQRNLMWLPFIPGCQGPGQVPVEEARKTGSVKTGNNTQNQEPKSCQKACGRNYLRIKLPQSNRSGAPSPKMVC